MAQRGRVGGGRRREALDVEAPRARDRERREARPVVVLGFAGKGVERGAARGRPGGAGGREAELLDRPVGRGGDAAAAKVEAERRRRVVGGGGAVVSSKPRASNEFCALATRNVSSQSKARKKEI
jgi:hypothetical protein